jgi:SOS response regulatory protein OraA/RecX
MKKGEPVPFVGWIDDQDEVEAILREQIHAQQTEINRLKQELMDRSKEDDFDMDGRC